MELKREKGFTLIETLVAIGAIATVGVLITQVFFTTTRSNTKTEILKDVKQNGDYAAEVMTRMLRNSIKVNSACSPTGTPLTSLEIVNADGGVTRFECVFDSSVARIASTSALSGRSDFITSANVTLGGASCVDPVSSLQFTCVSNVDQPPQISLQFQLSQRRATAAQFEKASIQFETTVIPRN